MGAVYKARDVELGRAVALKLLHPSVALDDSSELRLKRELLLASKVSHPNVVRVFDFGEMHGTKFISMAFVEGENLKSLLGREGRLPVSRAVHLAAQLSEGLAAAHAVGIVHRDLKPQNILLDADGKAYIADFGLAKSAAELHIEVTRPGERPGSPAYMSPEQAMGLPVDHRSDLYSLGLVLYEMVTGSPPHAANSSLFDHMRFRCRAKSPAQQNPEVPDTLADLILRCLEFDPNRRYQSASQILGELPSPQAEPAEGNRAKRWPRKYTLCGAIAALVLVGTVILVPGTPRPAGETRVLGLSTPSVHKLAFIPFRVIGDKNALGVIADSLTEAVSSKVAQSGRVRLFLDEGGGLAGSRTQADAILAGSVRAEGSGVLVAIYVTDCATGERSWTREFQTNSTKLLRLEDEIWGGLSKP